MEFSVADRNLERKQIWKWTFKPTDIIYALKKNKREKLKLKLESNNKTWQNYLVRQRSND